MTSAIQQMQKERQGTMSEKNDSISSKARIKMDISKATRKMLLIILFAFIIGNISPFALASQNIFPAFLRRGLKSTWLHASFFSYKPKLEQLNEILNSFGSQGIDAALMSILSITLQHPKELSSRIEIGYWTNSTQLPLQTEADLSATFIPVSLMMIYHPVMLNEFIPLYFGGGIGYSSLRASGSAINLLEQQGITFDEEDVELTGYALIGLEYLFYGDKLVINFEAKPILKTFMTSGTYPFELDFDGTAIGMGIGFRF